MLNKLIKLADNLDMLDLNSHADTVDWLIKRASSEGQLEFSLSDSEENDLPLSDDEKIVNFIEDVFNPNFEVNDSTSLIDAYYDNEYLAEYVLDIFPDKISDLWCSIDNKDGFDLNIKSIDGEKWKFLDKMLDKARGHAFAREKEIINIIGLLRRELASYHFDISC